MRKHAPEEDRVLIRRVLKEGPFSLRELAADAGVKYQTLRTWAAGLSGPRREGMQLVAQGLRKRAEVLQDLAAELDGAAGEE
jgi:hypothetical protein